jgi:hypothetical protein
MAISKVWFWRYIEVKAIVNGIGASIS